MECLEIYQNQIADVKEELMTLSERILILDGYIKEAREYNSQLKKTGSWFARKFKKEDVESLIATKKYYTSKLRKNLVLLGKLRSNKEDLIREGLRGDK